MASFSDDEREQGHSMENGGGSDEDEIMEDVDQDQEDEDEDEPEPEPEPDEEDNDNDEDDVQDEEPDADQEEEPQRPRSRSTTDAPSNRRLPLPRPGADTAPSYDIVPYVAAPMSTSINAFCATPCMRWIFTGGSDGFIRRFDWFGSMNGRVPLTVAQRHPFVDSVTRAGVLLSYWENEEPAVKSNYLHVPETTDDLKLSPVYSLAVHNQSLWLLSGLESGGINLQSVRHDEGKIIHTLRKHASAVSVLTLAADEKSVISGSWDRNVYDWDLNTGKVVREFSGSAGQISAVAFRPYTQDVGWEDISREVIRDGVGDPSGTPAPMTNGIAPSLQDEPDAPGSPAESIRSFGSLFGDDEMGDEMSEMNQAIVNGFDEGSASREQQPPDDRSVPNSSNSITTNSNTVAAAAPSPPSSAQLPPAPHPPGPTTDQNTFLAAGMDGTLRLWDRRMPLPIAVSQPSRNVPPWCMSSVWSTDGNFVYAGRRNGCVEEYSVHKGLSIPTRTLKFPLGSGSVTAMTAMPNGRHLICASFDNLRLWDLRWEERRGGPTTPFLIIPGHHGGVVSHLHVDRTCRYLISAAGNRGWEGANTEVLLGYEIVW